MPGRFQCVECVKAFTAKSTLNGHLASAHRGERSVCEACQKVFTDKSNLRRHRRTCSGNAGLHRCAWHQLGCDHTSNRVDNVKRHMRSCPHNPVARQGEVPEPVRANDKGPAQDGQVLDNRTPQVNGLQPAAQEAPALAQGPAAMPAMGMNATQQGNNLAPGDFTDPVLFAANFPQFDGYWGQNMPQMDPAAVPESPAALMADDGLQQGFAPEWDLVDGINNPFTAYGSGGGVFLTKPQGLDDFF